MKEYERQYIGVLASKNDLKYGDPIFINRQNSIQYIVKSLTLPEQDLKTASGFISSLSEDADFEDNLYNSEEDRVRAFKEYTKEKVFIYQYDSRYDSQDDEMGRLRNYKTNLVAKPSAFTDDDRFYQVPVFQRDTDEIQLWERNNKFDLKWDNQSIESLEKRIKNKDALGAVYGYDPDQLMPSFVVWKDDESFTAVGHIIKNYQVSIGTTVFECDYMYEVDITEYMNKVVYSPSTNPSLMFIAEKAYSAIENMILAKDDNEMIYQTKGDVRIIKSPATENEEPSDSELGGYIMSDYTSSSTQMLKEKSNMTDPEVPENLGKTDGNIIKMMNYYSNQKGLHYDVKDFINFHTSVKCGNLVILSGLSGTGKSSIVNVYADALGIQTTGANKRLLFIPVRPSWNDDSDLLGYVDLVHMVYRASDSGFVDFLVRAQKEENKNNIYIVCFDEMNLSRVEHYFSQFLSLLERDSRNRVLQLYDEQYSGKLYNSKEYPSSITIGENIKFIGTVNIDESTYHFSDKVLDRANVIELNVLNYAKDWDTKTLKTVNKQIWTMSDYEKISKSFTVNQRVHEMLWDIHEMLHAASTKFGVGPRIVKSIDLYLSNLPEDYNEVLSLAEGIDIQVAQRVLTKVRGSENELGDILSQNGSQSFEQIFDKYSDLSSFVKCREVLKQKQKELKAYGYCI